jgi:hypothetical protein
MEWHAPAEATKWAIDSAVEDDPHAKVRRYKTRLGRLKAAGVTIRNSATSEVKDTVIAFRPGGGPIYTAILSTTEGRYKKDRDVFGRVLRGFRLVKWR